MERRDRRGRLLLRARAIVPTVILAVGLAAASCGGGLNASPAAPSTPGALTGSAEMPALADMLADKRIGSAVAPNTIILYSSLGCPHCADFHTRTLPSLKSQYLDTGVAGLVYRDFPLDRPSLLGAMAARCAGESRYFAALDVIYRSQATWGGASDGWAAMRAVLRDAGMAPPLLDACAANSALEQGVMAIRQEGVDTYGVNATPTFIVNGTRVVGNVPLGTLTSYFR